MTEALITQPPPSQSNGGMRSPWMSFILPLIMKLISLFLFGICFINFVNKKCKTYATSSASLILLKALVVGGLLEWVSYLRILWSRLPNSTDFCICQHPFSLNVPPPLLKPLQINWRICNSAWLWTVDFEYAGLTSVQYSDLASMPTFCSCALIRFLWGQLEF